jgi:hypothetical protein
MSEMERGLDRTPLGANSEATDSEQKVFGYGTGGVPWYLLLLYLGFLVFFTMYVLDFQLPDFLNQGPGQGGEPMVRSIQ